MQQPTIKLNIAGRAVFYHAWFLTSSYGACSLQQIKEEKEKKIRGQEAEQRKLVSDIQEMTSSFDKEVLDLFNQRLQVRILELFCSCDSILFLFAMGVLFAAR